MVLVSVLLRRLGVIGVYSGLGGFLLLSWVWIWMSWILWKPTVPLIAHRFGVSHFRFLRILSHYVTELALIFSEHPCRMQDTEFDTHVHGRAQGPLPSLAIHTCLTDSTLYYFSFVVYAVMPLSFKEGDDPSSLVHLFTLAMH